MRPDYSIYYFRSAFQGYRIQHPSKASRDVPTRVTPENLRKVTDCIKQKINTRTAVAEDGRGSKCGPEGVHHVRPRKW